MLARVATPRPTPPRHIRKFSTLPRQCCPCPFHAVTPAPGAAEADPALAPGKGVILVVL